MIYQNIVLNMCVCSVAKLCPTLCDPMDCSLPGSPVHGILQVGILEWAAMPSSRSSRPRDWIYVSCLSCLAGGFFTHWATWEAPVLNTGNSFKTCLFIYFFKPIFFKVHVKSKKAVSLSWLEKSLSLPAHPVLILKNGW